MICLATTETAFRLGALTDEDTRNDYNYALKTPRVGGATARPRQARLCSVPSNGMASFLVGERGSPGDIGHIETLVKRETEQAVAARLAALELLDPSQKRPTPTPNILNRVDFIDF